MIANRLGARVLVLASPAARSDRAGGPFRSAGPSTTSGGLRKTAASDAWGINNRGDVVGFSTSPFHPISPRSSAASSGRTEGYRTSARRSTTAQALAINDRGTIVAHTGYGDEVWLFKDGQWIKIGPGVP
jgi:hypothetical protein